MESIAKKISGLLGKRISLVVSCLALIFILLNVIKEWENLINFGWSLILSNIVISFLSYVFQLLVMFCIWHLIIVSLTPSATIYSNANAFFLSAVAKRIPTPIPFVSVRFSSYKFSQNKTAIIIIGSILELLVIVVGGCLSVLLFLFWTHIQTNDNNWLMYFSILTLLITLTLVGIPSLTKILSIRFGDKTTPIKISAITISLWIGLSIISYMLNLITIGFLINGISTVHITLHDALLPSVVYYSLTYVTMYFLGGFGVKEMVFGVMLQKVIFSRLL